METRSRGEDLGRKNRRPASSRAPATAPSVVRGGFSGGRYAPLKDSELAQIHEASLEALETLGMADPIDAWRDIVCERGGWMTETGRLCIPRALVRDAIATAGRDFTLYGRDARHDMLVSGSRVHFTGGSATVQCQEIETGHYRPTVLKDLYDYSRLEDTLDNLHFVIRQCIPNDLPDARDLDLNTAYAVMSGTTKHIVTSFFDPEHLRETVRMYDLSLKGERRFRDRPFAHGIVVIAVSPLRFSKEGCHVLMAAMEEGMPALLACAPQSGATSPAALAGHLVQGHAENLAALTCVNLLKPGYPVIYGFWPFITDLKTGSFIGGGGEFAVSAAAVAQLGRYLNLPTGTPAGISDSKVPDAQSGWEKGMLTTATALAGANLIYEAAGILASIMATSYEAFVIDNDMLGSVLRLVRGIEVTPASLSLDTMREAVNGPGHYLGAPQTLDLMKTEYYYPSLANRQNIGGWEAAGAPDIRRQAAKVVRHTLSHHFPTHIDESTDQAIRARFGIRLERPWMRPGTGRWYDDR